MRLAGVWLATFKDGSTSRQTATTSAQADSIFSTYRQTRDSRNPMVRLHWFRNAAG